MFKRLDNEGFDSLHAWIWDRTRSVRKDLRTQVVEKRHDIQTLLTCLEASARFYLLSMHQMAQSEKEDYSHQQDMEQFNQTLTTLRERYDDNRRAGIASDNEAEFVAYRLILASLYANSQLENELHSLPSDLRHNKRVLTAIEIFKAAKSAFNFGSDKGWIQAQANWKKFWDLIKSASVSYLMACAAEVSFNRVRHVILDSLWHAYRKGPRGEVNVDAWTTARLKDILAMDDTKEVVRLCELFGFQFERNAGGQTYLDIAKLGNSNKSLSVPHSIKPQMFSRCLVESKRHNRAFSAVIQGMTIQQAKSSGLLVNSSTAKIGNEDSLFIPDTTAKPNNVFTKSLNGATTTNGTSNPSPFASPFNPPSQTSSGNSSSNPFLNNALAKTIPQTQSPQAAPSSTFGGAWSTPGVFDASKNSIKFASEPAVSAISNPFATAATTLLPQSTTPASTPPTSFIFGGGASPGSKDQNTSDISQVNNQNVSVTPKPFVFPGLPALDAGLPGEQQPETSATPVGSPPHPDPAAQAAEKQKAEEEARKAVLKRKEAAEQQRKQEREEQERKAKEEQQAREAERRRIEEENQRQLRERQQQELRAKQERERLVREEQQRQQQKEQERLARIRQRETAYNELTSSIIFSGEEGLLYQFLENTVKSVAEEVTMEVQLQRRRAREAVEKEQKRLEFARAVFARWVEQVQKKKRSAKTRERRKRLKAQREQSTNSDSDAVSQVPAAEPVASRDQLNDASKPRGVSSDGRHARRTQERSTSAITEQTSSLRAVAAAAPQVASLQPKRYSATAAITNGHSLHARSYSEAYQKSTAPMDRTETDWFKLRAMGIDPSKHRKRSFDSATDEEPKEDAEAKRVRRSDSSAALTPQPPPQPEASSKPLTLEERLARIRTVKQSFRISGSGSPPGNGAITNKRSSLNGRSSLLIAQARDLIAKSPLTKHTSPVVHDFGRSVPNLSTSTSSLRQSSFSKSSFNKSSFGKSIGSAQSSKPAYWGRASRFVPQHLYGKGSEAIRAYRDQYVNSPTSTPRPASMEPLVLSSPIPTRFSHIPQPGYAPPEDSESGSESGVGHVDIDAEDNIAGDTEEDSYDGDDDARVNDHDQFEEDEEDGDEDDEDNAGDTTQSDTYAEEYAEDDFTEEEGQHSAQPENSFGDIGLGATQDDAIELSD